MNSIDIKSLLIGALLTSTVIFGVAATGKTDSDAWDSKQRWEFQKQFKKGASIAGRIYIVTDEGWEAVAPVEKDESYVWARRRVK